MNDSDLKAGLWLWLFILALGAGCIVLGTIGCAAKVQYRQLSAETLAPGVDVEIWQNKQTGKCERRAFVGPYYYHSEVPCPAVKSKKR